MEDDYNLKDELLGVCGFAWSAWVWVAGWVVRGCTTCLCQTPHRPRVISFSSCSAAYGALPSEVSPCERTATGADDKGLYWLSVVGVYAHALQQTMSVALAET